MIRQALCCCARIQICRTPLLKFRKLETFSYRQVVRKYSFENKMRFSKSQLTLQNSDGLTPDFELIYKAPLRNYLIVAVMTITSTSVIFIGVILARLIIYDALPSEPLTGSDQVIIADDYEFYAFCAMLATFLILVKIVVSRYVLRVYCSGDKYTAVFRSFVPGKFIKLNFSENQVSQVKKSRFSIMGIHGFTINNKKAILFPDYFRTPHDFYLMIGGNPPE